MNGARRRWQLPMVLATLVACATVHPDLAQAQAGDSWSFVITPQVWLSHIAKNGFASPPEDNGFGGFLILDPGTGQIFNPLTASTSSSDAINPQWGIQFAAQKGRLTLAGAFQYVNFQTQNDLRWVAPSVDICFPPGFPECQIQTGQQYAQEQVKTTRMDVDFSASYFFPDVVRNRLDASLGGGLKFVYATSFRQYRNLSPFADTLNFFVQALGLGTGLYTVCSADDCIDGVTRGSVNEDSQIYGATFPMNATLHLTNDARWLLPFSITPLLGVEHRNDHDVVYSISLPANIDQLSPDTIHVNRLDGWKFAWGFTSDLMVRWIITDAVSAYAGMRVQYIQGFNKYLGYGPLIGMSVRFGGK
jgi:hypothetical protein